MLDFPEGGTKPATDTSKSQFLIFGCLCASRAPHGQRLHRAGDFGGVLSGVNWPHRVGLLPATGGARRACHSHSGSGARGRRAGSVSACARAGETELRALDLGAFRGSGLLRGAGCVLHVLRGPWTACRHSCRPHYVPRRRSSRRPGFSERCGPPRGGEAFDTLRWRWWQENICRCC